MLSSKAKVVLLVNVNVNLVTLALMWIIPMGDALCCESTWLNGGQ